MWFDAGFCSGRRARAGSWDAWLLGCVCPTALLRQGARGPKVGGTAGPLSRAFLSLLPGSL